MVRTRNDALLWKLTGWIEVTRLLALNGQYDFRTTLPEANEVVEPLAKGGDL